MLRHNPGDPETRRRMLAQFKVCATDLQGKVEPNKTLRLIEKKLDQFPLHAFDDPLRFVSSPLDQCHQFVGCHLSSDTDRRHPEQIIQRNHRKTEAGAKPPCQIAFFGSRVAYDGYTVHVCPTQDRFEQP